MNATVADVLRRDARWSVSVGDCLDGLRAMPDGCAQTCVTSPPYYGLRDYGNAAQIGQEPTPREFVEALLAVFAEVRRVLSDDGTLWLNLGDSYVASPPGACAGDSMRASTLHGVSQARKVRDALSSRAKRDTEGLRAKQLMGVPWRVAFALQDAGWWLRSDIIWSKPSPMPESVTDRPTRAHEYVFLLSKRARYFYDADAIREAASAGSHGGSGPNAGAKGAELQDVRSSTLGQTARALALDGRNARSVWTITPEPYEGAHFATMPPELAQRCILAGSRKGDVVVDPFGGAGTTALVALAHQRRALLCELNADYVPLMRERLAAVDTDAAEPLRMAAGADFGPLFGGAR